MDGSRDAISVSTEDFRDESGIAVPTAELEQATPMPLPTLAGFGLWGLSSFFMADGSFSMYAGWNIFSVFLLPAIGYAVSFPIRQSTIARDLDLKKKTVTAVLLLCILLVATSIFDSQTDAPWYFCVSGAILLFFSYHFLRRSRKMGITWDIYGRANFDIYVQNLGALTLLFGFFLIWVGTNAQFMAAFDAIYVPIYLSYRATVAFVAGLVIIVPSLLLLDLAFDEGSQPTGYQLDGTFMERAAKSVAFVTLEPFAKYLETPWIFISGWILFGLTSFMPFGNGFTFQKLFTFLICMGIGCVYGLKVLPAYWNGDMDEFRKWNYVYYALMAFLFTAIGVKGDAGLITALLSVCLILLGQYQEMNEKKKGKFWMRQRETNPEPEAFGYGHPISVTGWILLCVSMATPM